MESLYNLHIPTKEGIGHKAEFLSLVEFVPHPIWSKKEPSMSNMLITTAYPPHKCRLFFLTLPLRQLCTPHPLSITRMAFSVGAPITAFPLRWLITSFCWWDMMHKATTLGRFHGEPAGERMGISVLVKAWTAGCLIFCWKFVGPTRRLMILYANVLRVKSVIRTVAAV
jgi:hypothetical protein